MTPSRRELVALICALVAAFAIGVLTAPTLDPNECAASMAVCHD